MKITRICSLVALTAALSGRCLAFTPEADNFNGPTLNTSRWWQYNSNPGGALVQTGKRLNFVVTSPGTKEDFSSIELLTSQPGYNESWDFIIELSNTSTLGKDAGCGFMIFNAQDRRDYLAVEFNGKAGIAGAVYVNNKKVEGKLAKSLGEVSKGNIRVRYSKTTKLMTFSASLTGAAEGYHWFKVGTFSPRGEGGVVNGNWKMTSGSGKFGIQLLGYGAPGKVAAGIVTLDNFSLTAVR